MVKILITGMAGQGVQWLGKKIAEQFLSVYPHQFASFLSEYGAANRTGLSSSQVVLSEGKISSPFVDEADVLVDLGKHRINYNGKMIKLNGEQRLNEIALKKVLEILNIK